MRVVLDTNVLFAAFATHGVCAGLYEECLLRGQIVVSQYILNELREKLATKARLSRTEIKEVLLAIQADVEVIPVRSLSVADKDLQILKQFEGIPILSPRNGLALLRNG